MIKKQNLWFFTLFSFILVLGVYYITMPDNLLQKVSETFESLPKEKVVIQEESPLLSMRVSLEEERKEAMEVLHQQLTSEKLTSKEKNNVYEELKYLNEVQGREENIEKKIKKEYDLDCFTKIENQNISVVCVSNEHDVSLANKIMRLVQKEYKEKKTITVKFQKK